MLNPESPTTTSNNSVTDKASNTKGVQNNYCDRSEKSKKRGVYVEKNHTILPNCCTDGQYHPVASPIPDRKQVLSSLLEILSKKTISTQYSIMSVLEKPRSSAKANRIIEASTQHEELEETDAKTATDDDRTNTGLFNNAPLHIGVSEIEYNRYKECRITKKSPIPKTLDEDYLSVSYDNNNDAPKPEVKACGYKEVHISKNSSNESYRKTTLTHTFEVKKHQSQDNQSYGNSTSTVTPFKKPNRRQPKESTIQEKYHVLKDSSSSKCGNDLSQVSVPEIKHRHSTETKKRKKSETVIIPELEIQNRITNKTVSYKNVPISLRDGKEKSRRRHTKESYAYKKNNSGVFVYKDCDGSSDSNGSSSSTESESKSWLNLVSLLLLQSSNGASDTVSSLESVRHYDGNGPVSRSYKNNFSEDTTDCFNGGCRRVNSRFEIETESITDFIEPLCSQPNLRRNSSSEIECARVEYIDPKDYENDYEERQINLDYSASEGGNENDNEEVEMRAETDGDTDKDADEIVLAEIAEKQKELAHAKEEEKIEDEPENQMTIEVEEGKKEDLEDNEHEVLVDTQSLLSYDDRFFDSDKETVFDEDDDDDDEKNYEIPKTIEPKSDKSVKKGKDQMSNDNDHDGTSNEISESIKRNKKNDLDKMKKALAAQLSNKLKNYEKEVKVYAGNPFGSQRLEYSDDEEDFMFIRTSNPKFNTESLMSISSFKYSSATPGHFRKSASDFNYRKYPMSSGRSTTKEFTNIHRRNLRSDTSTSRHPRPKAYPSRYARPEFYPSSNLYSRSDYFSDRSSLASGKRNGSSRSMFYPTPSDLIRRRYTASEYAQRVMPTLSEATRKRRSTKKTLRKRTKRKTKKSHKKSAANKKKVMKHKLINSFKKELSRDLPVYEEPTNLFQTLKTMAINKRMSGPTKRFRYYPKNYDGEERTVTFQDFY